MSNTADTSTTGKHVPALDGIRGLAVLLVFGVHLFFVNSVSHNPLVRAARLITHAGWVGVDLFFTLSGFLITGILYDTLKGSRYLRNFYARRALRIFPLYYAFFALSFLLTLPTRFHWNASVWLYLTYTYTPFQGSPAVSDATWMNLVHFWSLVVEEQFYLVWPLVVLLCRTRRRIVTAAALFAVGSFALRVWLEVSGVSRHNPFIPYEWTLARLDELSLGAILAIAVRSRFRAAILRAAPAASAVAVCLVAAYAIGVGRMEWLDDPRVRTVGFSCLGLTAAALIAACLSAGSPAQRLFSAKLLRFFGKYSYGLYLLHLPLLYALQQRALPVLQARMSQGAAMQVTGVIAFAITLPLAMLSFHFFEQPILTLKRHFQDDSPTPKLRRQLNEAA